MSMGLREGGFRKVPRLTNGCAISMSSKLGARLWQIRTFRNWVSSEAESRSGENLTT